MKTHHVSLAAILLAVAGTALPLSANINLSYSGQVDLPGGGEIVAYTKDQYTLAATYFTGTGPGAAQGVKLYDFQGAGSPNGHAYLVGGFEGVDGTGANAGIGIFAPTPVPEPSTYALLGTGGLGGLILWRRRTQSRAAWVKRP